MKYLQALMAQTKYLRVSYFQYLELQSMYGHMEWTQRYVT